MDLTAYSQIEDLKHFLQDNKINIPRLRGLRLMKDEEVVTEKEILDLIEIEKREYAINWLKQHCDWCWSSDKENKRHKAFIYGKNEIGEKDIIKIDFSKVHGKDRKHIKYHWKLIVRAFNAQYEVWNRYVGKNVLYVHAKKGSDSDIDKTHRMFLEIVDDAWDGNYCDIYYDLDSRVGE